MKWTPAILLVIITIVLTMTFCSKKLDKVEAKIAAAELRVVAQCKTTKEHQRLRIEAQDKHKTLLADYASLRIKFNDEKLVTEHLTSELAWKTAQLEKVEESRKAYEAAYKRLIALGVKPPATTPPTHTRPTVPRTPTKPRTVTHPPMKSRLGDSVREEKARYDAMTDKEKKAYDIQKRLEESKKKSKKYRDQQKWR